MFEKGDAWREHTGPLGVEPPTKAELEKKAKEAAEKARFSKSTRGQVIKKKAANSEQFDESDLKVMSAVND